MTAPTVIPTETPISDLQSLAAQDAAEALITLGWPVLPVGQELVFWALGNLIFTDDELLAFALRRGIQLFGERA